MDELQKEKKTINVLNGLIFRQKRLNHLHCIYLEAIKPAIQTDNLSNTLFDTLGFMYPFWLKEAYQVHRELSILIETNWKFIKVRDPSYNHIALHKEVKKSQIKVRPRIYYQNIQAFENKYKLIISHKSI